MIEFIFDYSWLMFIPFLVGISFNKQSSEPTFRQFPGAFGPAPVEERIPYTPPKSTGSSLIDRVMNKSFMNRYNQTPQAADYAKSAELATSLQERLMSPLGTFGFAPTASEQALLDSIMDLTAGRGAVRGLGPPTQTALASAIAPTLVDLRKQDIATALGLRGQDISGLLELIGLVMPQTVGGQRETGSNFGITGPSIGINV